MPRIILPPKSLLRREEAQDDRELAQPEVGVTLEGEALNEVAD
jgi:hypothetical protein